jgi:hypothetical protein
MRNRDPRRGGVLLGLLISALVIVCVVVAIGITIARNIRIESHDRDGSADVSIDTPAGHFSVHAHDKPGMVVAGVPAYPGARARKDSGGNAVVQWSSAGHNGDGGSDKGFAVSASDMITSDPAYKVVDFYRNQLPTWMITEEKNGGTHIELHKGGYQRIISIEEKSDGTHIGVASIGEPASN